MIIQLFINDAEQVQGLINEAYGIVLLQSGVYCAQALAINNLANVYGLKEDFEAAGVTAPNQVKLISCEEWVELCATHYPVVTIQ